MNRTSIRWDLQPKHYSATVDLLAIVADFQITIAFGEIPCYVLRQNMINIIATHRPGIQACSTPLENFIRRIKDESISNHNQLVSMLNELSIACKLANVSSTALDNVELPKKLLTNKGFFKQLKVEILKLDECKEYRWIT